MRKVQCGECGKRYDFDVDDFCPKCGAFNQPPRDSRIGADGTVIRVDGLNEANHQDSFVHRELHEENRERRGTALSKGIKRTARTVNRTAVKTKSFSSEKGKKNPVAIVGKIILWIFILNIFANIMGLIFSLL